MSAAGEQQLRIKIEVTGSKSLQVYYNIQRFDNQSDKFAEGVGGTETTWNYIAMMIELLYVGRKKMPKLSISERAFSYLF